MGQLQNRMGHSTPETTLKHYVKLVHGDWLDYWGITHDKATTAAVLDRLNGTTDEQQQVRTLLVLMNAALLGALVGLVWGVYLFVDFAAPAGYFEHTPIGFYFLAAIGALFVLGTIVLDFSLVHRHQ
jgi:hypothetical protein